MIEKSFEKIINNLSEKEKNVMIKRVWLNWDRLTLQSIGNSFNPCITRERVRQIEDSWIKKIWRIIKNSELVIIQDKAKELIKLHDWLIWRTKLINHIIKELKLESNINTYIIETIIQADYDVLKSKPKLWTQIYFNSPSINKSLIQKIYKEWLKLLKKRKDVLNKIELYNQIKKNIWNDKLSIIFIDSVLDIFEDIIKWEEDLIWLTKWKILNPKTLKDKSIYILKKAKVPMHFIDIANKVTEYIWSEVKVNTVHNELIRNDEFVLIWRWLYALKEWGFKSWAVIDVIVDILKKSKEALSTESIIKNVLKVRKVKKTTIYMNLQNKDIIERVWRNFYNLKNKEL